MQLEVQIKSQYIYEVELGSKLIECHDGISAMLAEAE